MIGIYKITKKENGKSYIGQSNDIERRFSEHKTKTDIPIDIAIQKYGVNAFEFSIIEECDLSQLDEKEKYWIAFYNTYKGFIRECYDAHQRRREVYKKFQDKISFDSFASIWDGTTWKDIKPEVYTKENLDYYKYHTTDGSASDSAKFTSEEVIKIRERYVNEDARSIYQDYIDRCSYQTLQQILWGRTYKDLPIYKKKQKVWVNK